MQSGTVRRSSEQRQGEEVLAGTGDAYSVQLALPLCSFTGLACVDSGDSTRCTFYWIDANRGLLGRGLIELSDKPSPQPAQPLSPGTVVPRLIGLTSARRQRRRSAEADVSCQVEVLFSGLKKPLRVAVAPGKAHRQFVFYTEAGAAVADLGISTRLIEDASLSVYDAETEETRVLASGLCDVRGLQVTPALDVIFMARPGPASSDLHVYVVRALDHLKSGGGRGRGGGGEPGRIRLLTLCEKPRFGHGTRHEDVALLPNGVVLVAVRIAETEGGADAGATGAVHAYVPDGPQPVPACQRPWSPPPPERPCAERDRRPFDHQDYVRQYLDWRAKHRPPTPPPPPPEEPVIPLVVSTPPTTLKAGTQRKLAGSPPPASAGQASAPRKSSSSAPPAGTKQAATPAPAGTKGKQAGGKPGTSPAGATAAGSGGRGAKEQQAPVHHRPSVHSVATVVTLANSSSLRRRRSAPPPIPPLCLPPNEDRYFHLDAPQPPRTARALRSGFQPCLTPLLPLEHLLTRTYPSTPTPIALDLPVTRMLAFSPVTLRLVLGCCGAGPDGQSAALGELEPWHALTDGPTPLAPAFRPLVGGFMACVAMDDYGTVLLRTARADGQLLVLWGRSTAAWRRLRLAAAAAVPLPISPRAKPTHTELDVSEAPPTETQAAPAVVAVVEKEAAVRPLDGKVAEWSKCLLASGMPDEGGKHNQRHTHLNNTFTDSGRVNTLVVLRCRPLLAEEKEAGAETCLSCTKNDVTVDGSYLPLRHKRTFHFDRVYDEAARQTDVYAEVVAPVVQRVLQGYSCTVFAYGQTGSGKTFTMEGSMDDGERAGIIPRSIYQIFAQLTKLPSASYRVKVSHVEIYNEQLHDLLKSHRKQQHNEDGGGEEKLRIEEGANRRIRLRGAREIPVRSPHDIFQILRKSIRNRHTAETKCNRESSRSHGIFTVRVRCSYVHAEEGELTFEGSLNLVDLSGSENIKRSGAAGMRAREAGTIGQSLLAFSRVITGLVNAEAHIPYRDSKLTHLLADSLGGKSYTTIILNVTPHARMLDETMNTLNYASLARNVYSKPKQTLQRKDAAGQTLQQTSLGPVRGGPADALPVRPWEGGVPMRRAVWRFMTQQQQQQQQAETATNTSTWPPVSSRATGHVYHSQALEWVQSAVLEADRLHLRREAVRALTDIFRLFDGNHDGVLVLSEVRRLHKAWVPDTLPPELLEAWTPPPARIRSLTRATLPCKQFLAFALDVAKKDPLFMLHIITTAGYGLGLSSTLGPAEASQAAGGEGTPIELLLYHNTPRPNPKTLRREGSSGGGGGLLQGGDGPVTSGFVNPGALFDYLEPFVKPTRDKPRPQSAQPAGRRASSPPPPHNKQAATPAPLLWLPPKVSLSRQVSNESVVTLESLDSYLSDDLSDSSLGSPTSSLCSNPGSPSVGTPALAFKKKPLANRPRGGGVSTSQRRPQSAPASRAVRPPTAAGRGGRSPSRSPIRPPGSFGAGSSPAFTPKPYHTTRSPTRDSSSSPIQPQQHVFFSSGMTTPMVRVPLCEWCAHKVVPGTLHSIAFCPEHA